MKVFGVAVKIYFNKFSTFLFMITNKVI